MDEYGRLRRLLLSTEQQEIARLQTALESLLKETRDPEQIVQRLVPLLSQIFSLTLQNNKTEFVKVFSPIVGELLQDTIKNSAAEMAVIMAPIMGKAIKEVVKNERDEIVDALYPVMGNMISKFVAETFKELMQEINEKVHSTLSFETIKRKITAKIKGISETELLLQSSSHPYLIQNVFLIHKETGILISERSASGIESIEPEMVASMLTAIRSFVNDWISKNSEYFELNEIEFGNSTIRLEVAGCCYLAVVLKGSLNREGQQRIVNVLERLVEDNAQMITEFDGDTQMLPMEEINSQLDTLTTQHESRERSLKKRKPWALWIIAVLIIASSVVLLYRAYLHSSAEKTARAVLYKDPQLNLYAIDVSVDGSVVTLEGRLPAVSLHKRLLESISRTLPEHIIDDHLVLTKTIPTHEQSMSILKAVVDTINNEEGNRVQFQFQGGVVNLDGLIRGDHAHERLLMNLSALPGVIRVVSALKVRPTGKAVELFYAVDESALHKENRALLDDWFEVNRVKTLLKLYPEVDLLVIGYSDRQGSAANRGFISKKRAENVFEYLMKKGISKERVTSVGVPAPPESKIKDVPHSGRSAQIKWVKR